jgi:hypothetical protein
MRNQFLLAAKAVLEKNHPVKTMTSVQITRKALELGVLKSTGKTPERTMNAQLNQDIKRNGDKSIFEKVGRSTFKIR